MTLTPAPNGAKAFNIAYRTSESWQRKKFFFGEGTQTQCLSSEELAFGPSAKRLSWHVFYSKII